MRGAEEGATEAYSCTPQGDPDEATKQMGPSRRRATYHVTQPPSTLIDCPVM